MVMSKSIRVTQALAFTAFAVSIGAAAFAEEGKAPAPGPAETVGSPPGVTTPAEPIFGREMMTEQEMAEQRARMRAAKTPEERERVRQEHHQQMVERAKQRGIDLPEQPVGPPAGAGRGMGMGSGMGPGPHGKGGGKAP